MIKFDRFVKYIALGIYIYIYNGNIYYISVIGDGFVRFGFGGHHSTVLLPPVFCIVSLILLCYVVITALFGIVLYI